MLNRAALNCFYKSAWVGLGWSKGIRPKNISAKTVLKLRDPYSSAQFSMCDG